MRESNWHLASRTDLARAIASAEGFPVEGSIPKRAHNPGDLVLGDHGYGTLGGEAITVFADDASGWAALEHQLDLIRKRMSHVYVPSMTIQQMADKWTRTQRKEWAENVSNYLTAHGRISTPDTKLSEVL